MKSNTARPTSCSTSPAAFSIPDTPVIPVEPIAVDQTSAPSPATDAIDQRLRQAARILVSGAIRAAQKRQQQPPAAAPNIANSASGLQTPIVSKCDKPHGKASSRLPEDVNNPTPAAIVKSP